MAPSPLPGGPSEVRIGLLLPEVLGTYGDSGNATVLRQRLQWRGVPASITTVSLGEPVPDSLDIYLMGGGEDDAQALAAGHLGQHPGMQRAVAGGAVVLGVCAGLQVLGTRFAGTDGATHSGLGLLDAETVPGERRSVSEIVAEPADGLLGGASLTGFENHRGQSRIGPGSQPLGRVVSGTGNGDGTEGAIAGRIVATYLHGPVLARNPALADLLLGWVLGRPLGPLEVEGLQQLRSERLAANRPRGLRRLLRRQPH